MKYGNYVFFSQTYIIIFKLTKPIRFLIYFGFTLEIFVDTLLSVFKIYFYFYADGLYILYLQFIHYLINTN